MRIAAAAGFLLLLGGCDRGSILEPEPGTEWVAIAAGGAHTCGILEDGRIACWGSNASGQLGVAPELSRSALPAFVSGGRAFEAVSAGDAHTCALDFQGAVWCWGSNEVGQLGDGTTLNRSRPARVLEHVSDFFEVSAGRRHTCALRADGQALCWGGNAKGQVGSGTTGTRAGPTLVANGDLRFAAIGAGGEHTCGIAGSGEVHCWGANQSGQLGIGTTTPSPSPNRVAGSHLFRTLSVGGDHNCAARLDEQVLCWGENGLGGAANTSSPILGTPYPAGWIDRARRVVAGQGPWSCAQPEGEAATCWGIRVGTVDGDTIPAADGSWAPGLDGGEVGPTELRDLSAGLTHGCLVTGGGEAYCWGEGREGQLGDGARARSLTLRSVGR